MRFYIVLIIFLCLTESSLAFDQSNDSLRIDRKAMVRLRKAERLEKAGDKLVKRYAFKEAAKVFEKALKYDDGIRSRLKSKIAACYREMNDEDNAKYWYGLITGYDSLIQGSHKLNYAEALASTGELEYAQYWFNAYQKSVSSTDRRVENRLKGINQIHDFYIDSANYELELLDANSVFSDFGPSFFGDDLVFTSARKQKGFKKFQSKYGLDETPYLDVYLIKKGTSEPILFSKRINTRLHEGPVAFINNNEEIFFTRNNYLKGKSRLSKDGINKLNLYRTQREGDGWGKVSSFSFNSDEYSVCHPAPNRNGTVLYFSSDMPGGFGSMDLYETKLLDDGNWSKPRNLGPEINTEGDEMFPFLSEENKLYFASNGHVGLGGLDVFYADFRKEVMEVVNLGYPINTLRDDFGLIIRQKSNEEFEGYVASNRLNGIGSDDIYGFIYKPDRYILLKGIATDKYTGVPLANASIYLGDKDGMAIDSVNSNKDGMFEFYVNSNATYELLGSKHDYSDDLIQTEIGEKSPEDPVVLRLGKDWLVVRGTISNLDTSDPLSSSKLIVENLDSGKKFGILTGGDGEYSFKADRNTRYSLVASKYRFFSMVDSVDTFTNESGDIIKNLELEQIEIGKSIALDDILFDLNKWNIRPDAALVLDKFGETLRINPYIIIELGTHTDSRGSDTYNLNLSDKRAASSRDYIIDHGIAENRIVSKGYGETVLLNECDDGVLCSEKQHNINRRAEFKVLGFLEEKENDENLLWIDPKYLSESLKNDPEKVRLLQADSLVDSAVSISGRVLDSGNNPLKDVSISFLDENSGHIIRSVSDENGIFTINVTKSSAVNLMLSKAGYIEQGHQINLSDNNLSGESVFFLQKGHLVQYRGIIKDNETGESLDGVSISILYENEEKYSYESDASGEFSFEGASSESYRIRFTKSGYQSLDAKIDELESGNTKTFRMKKLIK